MSKILVCGCVPFDMTLGVEDILISWFVTILALLGVASLFVCCMIHCKHLHLSDANKLSYLLTYLPFTLECIKYNFLLRHGRVLLFAKSRREADVREKMVDKTLKWLKRHHLTSDTRSWSEEKSKKWCIVQLVEITNAVNAGHSSRGSTLIWRPADQLSTTSIQSCFLTCRWNTSELTLPVESAQQIQPHGNIVLTSSE